MFGDWDGGDEVAGWSPDDVDVPVPVVPGYLTARDAAWRPDGDGFDPGFARGAPGDEGDVPAAVDAAFDAQVRQLAAAVDSEPWLVVPDDAPTFSVVRDERGCLVSTVAGVAPGGELAAMLEQLTTLPIGITATTATAPPTATTVSVSPAAAATPVSGLRAVSDLELGEVVAACQRLASWARGTQAEAVAELSRREVMQPLPSGAGFASVSAQASTALEVTGVLAVTSGQARNLVAESVELVEVFPATHAALTAGVVDERRARVILAELRTHEPDIAHLVEATVLAQAASLNTTQLRRKIKALLLRLAPVTSEERHARAREDRHVRFNPGEDGMVWFEGLLPAEDAAALKAVLEAGQQSLKRRDTTAGDARARSAQQRRADTLAYLAWTALSNGRITPPGPAATSGTDDAETATTGTSATHGDHAADAAGDADAGTAQTAADAPDAPDAAGATAEEAAVGAHAREGTGDGAGGTSSADGAAGVDTADAADRADANGVVDAERVTDSDRETAADTQPNDDTGDTDAAEDAAGTGPPPTPPGPGPAPGSGSAFGTPSEPSGASVPAGADSAGGTCQACGGAGLNLATAHRRPVTVNVTIPLSTLLGLDEHPGHLDGYGPIPAHIARHLSTAGLWRWVATHDTTGAILNHGRTRYTPTQDLIDHVILRDRTCRAPGCHAPAEVCELDHSIYWPHGPTAACNLGLFCKQHHLQKHHTRWRIEQPQPGVFHWISPTGRIIKTGPEPSDKPLPGDHPPEPREPEPPPEPGPEPEPQPDSADDIPPF